MAMVAWLSEARLCCASGIGATLPWVTATGVRAGLGLFVEGEPSLGFGMVERDLQRDTHFVSSV
jgi:hypothetical protein